MSKFKAVYDEAAEPVRIRHKDDTTKEATVLAKFGDDVMWILADGDDGPYTASVEYWEPVPKVTPSEALPGDVWTYAYYGFATKYRVLGVDLKAGVWHFVDDEGFDYKSKPNFQTAVTVYTHTLPDGSDVLTQWRLVKRP